MNMNTFDRCIRHINEMRQINKDMIAMITRLLFEKSLLEEYVKLQVSYEIDELERKFPIMAEHYKYMRWEQLPYTNIGEGFRIMIRWSRR